MKILFINDVGSEAGGAETIIQQLSSSLRRRGNEVKLLSGNEYHSSVKINDYEFKSFSDKSFARFLLFMYNPFAASKLKQVLRDFNPDVVHLHNVKKASSSILFLLKDYPTIMTAHDLSSVDQTAFEKIEILQPYKQSLSTYFIYQKNLTYLVQRIRFILLRRAQRNIDLIITPSHAMEAALHQGGVPAPITTIHHGLSRKKLAAKARSSAKVKLAPTILFVGRFVENKGLGQLLMALSTIRKSLPGVKLIAIGDGPAKTHFHDLARQLGLTEAVEFLGWVKQKDVVAYYEKSDLVVIPSQFFEPLGIVAIEAMMYARPVVVTRVGGLPELVDAEITGRVVDRDDTDQLAMTIVELFQNPAKLRKMGENNLKKSEEFSSRYYTVQIIDAYKGVLSLYRS
jgi:glycosyltransferase involved in cell wall biosynthesis